MLRRKGEGRGFQLAQAGNRWKRWVEKDSIYLHCSSGELDVVLDKLGEDQDYQEEEDISVSQKSGNGKIFNRFYSRVRGFNFRGIFNFSFRIQDSKFFG